MAALSLRRIEDEVSGVAMRITTTKWGYSGGHKAATTITDAKSNQLRRI